MTGRTYCYLDLKIGDDDLERVVIELYDDICPKTAANFKALCTGEQKTDERNLHFLNMIFHRVIVGFMIQGGDVTRMDGTGGYSIYGAQFDDENFEKKHDRPFLLSMANRGPNTNSSQFFITTAPAPHLDDKHVVFGEVLRGQGSVREVEGTMCLSDKPVVDCWVADCGVLAELPEPVGDELYHPCPQDCTLDISKASKVLEAATMMKTCGNELFKGQKFSRAKHKYDKAIRYLEHDGYEPDEECKAIKISCKLNLAACCVKLGKFKDVVSNCSYIVDADAASAKCYFRRGQGYSGLSEFLLAIKDLQKAMELAPEDKAIRQELERARKKHEAQTARDRKAYSKMFQ